MNRFEKLAKAYNDSKLMVEMVKKGDVVYQIDAAKILIDGYIEDLEVKYANTTNSDLRQWYEGKLDSYKMALDILKEISKAI
jgi:hypothetical protein